MSRTVAGETILVPIRERLGDLESIYTLNPVATFVWEHLAQPASLAELTAAALAAFDADPDEVRRDLQDFMSTLTTLRAVRALVEPSGSSGTTPRT